MSHKMFDRVSLSIAGGIYFRCLSVTSPLQDFFIGEQARKLRGVLKLNQPMRHGIVTDWPDMTSLWKYAYAELNVAQEEVRHSRAHV